jgi:hypothetical protein
MANASVQAARDHAARRAKLLRDPKFIAYLNTPAPRLLPNNVL